MNKNSTRDYKLILVANLVFIIVVFGLCWYKYYHFLYNALDLAIFNNVYYQLVNFGSFYSSIQGHTYLADHFNPLMLVYAPAYAIFNHALTLLLLQTLTLSLTSLVVYQVSKTFFLTKLNKPTKIFEKIPLLLALAWLINPLVWNISLFEFHIIPLAIPLLLLAFNYYLKENFKLYGLFLILSLLVREDVALVVLMFSVVAWLDKKPLKYRLLPLVAVPYFIFSYALISHYSAGSYRFLIYYSWLGKTMGEIIKTIFTNPLLWLKHFVSLANLDMLVGLLFPFLFLPLKKPKYLLLALLPTAQFIFSQAGGSNLIIQTHYATLFLPALFIATLDAIAKIKESPRSRWLRLINFDPALSRLIIPVVLFLTFVGFGPLGKVLFSPTKPSYDPGLVRFLENIPPEKVVAGSFDFLPAASTRANLYSTHYLFSGQQQFSQTAYQPRQEIDMIVFNPNDLLSWWLKTSDSPQAVGLYQENLQRWQAELTDFRPEIKPDEPITWTRTENFVFDPFSSTATGCAVEPFDNFYQIECLVQEPAEQVYFLKITLSHSDEIIPFLWRQKNEAGQKAYAIFFLNNFDWTGQTKLELVKISGQTELGPWLNVINIIYSTEVVAKIYW